MKNQPSKKAEPQLYWIVDSSQMNGQPTRVYKTEPRWLIGAVEWERAIEISAYQALQEKLDVATEALKQIANEPNNADYYLNHIADEAIRKIEGHE